MKTSKEKIIIDKNNTKPLVKKNFICMGIAGALIVIGFLLMGGSSNGIGGEFNPDIFSTRRIVVGPFIAFIGFAFMAVAIIWPFNRKQ